MSADKVHYYLVSLLNPEETFPCWEVHSVRTRQVPEKNGHEGSTKTEWALAVHAGHGGSKRAALAEGRRLAEADDVPLLIEEDRSVERRKTKAALDGATRRESKT